MSHCLRFFAILITLLFAVGQSSSAHAKAKHVIKLATVAPDNTPWSTLLKRYKKAVEKRSGGRIKLKVFLGGMLGDENDAVIKCKRGQIQAVAASTGAMASQVPELNLVELPYLFRGPKEADYVIDNVITVPMEKVFRKYGLVLGFWSENGFRHFGTKDKFVTKPSVLRGKKMRSQESSVHLGMWRAYGASPVPIPTTEVLTALQTGAVDGFDQAMLYTIAASWHKTIKYYTLSGHIYQPAVIAFNKKWFDKLPADLKVILIEEGRKTQKKGRKLIRAINADLQAILEDTGVKTYKLKPAERAVFEKASVRVWNSFRKRHGKVAAKLLDDVLAALKKHRDK